MSTTQTAPTGKLSSPLAASLPFYYGWIMLAIAMMAAMATSPGQTYGVAVFNPSLRETLQLSESQLSFAYLLGTLLACLPQTIFGSLMDRYGNQRVMVFAVIGFAAACVFMSTVQNWAMLVAAFLLLRMLGQGLLSLTANNTIAMWFQSRLGAASAIACLGGAFSIATVPGLTLWSIGEIGWRWTYAASGILICAVLLPLLLLVYRNRPEDVAQAMDGGRRSDRQPTGDELDDINLTLGEAAQTRAFWILLTLTSLWSLVGTGIMFSILPIFTSRGLAETDASRFFVLFAYSLGAMQIVGGILADRVRLNVLYFVAMVGSTSALLVLTLMDSTQMAQAFSLMFGASQGLFVVVGQTIWPRFFGRTHLGKIRGAMWTTAVAASSIGPFVLGGCRDLTGSYSVALWAFVAIYGVLSIAALGITQPRRVRCLSD